MKYKNKQKYMKNPMQHDIFQHDTLQFTSLFWHLPAVVPYRQLS